MNTIYIHRRFREKTLSIRNKKKSRAKQEINDTHMQCSSMRNTPSHVSQTKQKRKKNYCKGVGQETEEEERHK